MAPHFSLKSKIKRGARKLTKASAKEPPQEPPQGKPAAMPRITREKPPPPPQWARDVDVAAGWNEYQSADFMFERAIPELKRSSQVLIEHNKFFQKLTVKIRRRIYYYVFDIDPLDEKRISLSQEFATKDVFPPGFYYAPWDVLHVAKGALLSCHPIRNEVMTYFWNTFKFHITISQFTLGPTFGGLGMDYLKFYATRINDLSLEIDLSRLSFSSAKDAYLLDGDGCVKNLSKVAEAIKGLVLAIRRREGHNYMKRLHLMVRRYDGFRPLDETAASIQVSLEKSLTHNSSTSTQTARARSSTPFSQSISTKQGGVTSSARGSVAVDEGVSLHGKDTVIPNGKSQTSKRQSSG
jgi:hypothetical protein